ncbi:MAG TPA: type II secretion system F family protein [Candidatus Nitrosotalea sp.]|nr:type II secretion system F family protein [Candidatus Nitrosotalea sp.]
MISVIAAVMVAAGIFIAFSSLARRNSTSLDSLGARLAIYDERTLTDRDIELRTKGFAQRVLAPGVSALGMAVAERTPDKQRQALQRRLEVAGHPGNMTPETFMALRIGAGVGLFLGGLVIGVMMGKPLVESLGAAIGAGLGYYYPVLWLNQKVEGRRKLIQKALPETLDLLTISVEAGLSFDQASQRVVEKFENPLSDELRQVQTEVSLGRPRLEALDAMGRRTGVDDLHNFVQAVIQSEQMGVGITRILRIQSEEMRRKRRQRAQEKAAQATLKMMLPMVGCIFPTLWIVLLGPAILILMKRGGP